MNYRLARRIAWRTLDDETIVLDLETKRMYGLNESAAFIWRTLGAMEDFDGMLRAMAGTSSESPPFAAEDLAAFCEELLKLGLLEKLEPEERVEERVPVAIDPPKNLEPPRILWQETLEQVAASCAFLPATSPLCTQVPFS